MKNILFDLFMATISINVILFATGAFLIPIMKTIMMVLVGVSLTLMVFLMLIDIVGGVK